MCTGDKLHRLRVSNGMSYSDLSKETKLQVNVIKGMEHNYIQMSPLDIFKLSKSFNINYIDLCSTWEEIEDCLQFRITELYSMKSPADLKLYNRKGFYVPNYTKVYPREYTLQTLCDMCSYHRKDLLGVKIKLYGLSRRLGERVSEDKITLSAVCKIAFCKNLNLSYVLGGK